MRICYLADGQSVHTQRWIRYFARNRSHDVHLVSFRPIHLSGIEVHPLKGNMIFGEDCAYLLAARRVTDLVRELKPDILHAHYITSYGFLARRSRVRPLVASAWGSDVLVTPRKSPLHAWLTRFVLTGTDLLTCESQAVADAMVKQGASRANILIVPGGVDFDLFRPGRERKTGVPVLLSPRDHKRVYNIDTILRAIALLGEEELMLVVAGDGPDRGDLAELARSLDISDRVTFTGTVPGPELASLYRQAAVVLSVPSSDSTSVALLEAMACGSFPIVSDLPANREWIRHGENGLIVEPRDERSLAKAIRRALYEHALREEATSKNLSLVREKADWELNMTSVERAYEELSRGVRT